MLTHITLEPAHVALWAGSGLQRELGPHLDQVWGHPVRLGESMLLQVHAHDAEACLLVRGPHIRLHRESATPMVSQQLSGHQR